MRLVQQHLWARLRMKTDEDMREQQVQPISEEDVQPQPDEVTTRQKSRVGEQQLVRLEVGESQDKGRTENCPFSGTVVELQSAQIRATGVEKLLCPACGAGRSATLRGELVIYPPHTPRRCAKASFSQNDAGTETASETCPISGRDTCWVFMCC